MSGAGRSIGAEQFYVTHCVPADSVRREAGYSVRAASTTASGLLDEAFHYPPYGLPFDMWRDRPEPGAAPRRLARTVSPRGGVWVAHSAYLAKDSVGRDRSFFSHLMLLPAASPAAVLRSWGAPEWTVRYPSGESKALPAATLPDDDLVCDASLTAFLGDRPPWPTAPCVDVCPLRLRVLPASSRRDLLARALHAVQLLAAEKPGSRKRLFIHAEPGVVALLLYGCVRLLPPEMTDDLTFSTFEPYHRDIRNYRLARVVGTYLGPNGGSLEPELGAKQGITLDTFTHGRSSTELSGIMPTGLTGLVNVAVTGHWEGLAEARRALAEAGDEGDDWIQNEVARARAELQANPALAGAPDSDPALPTSAGAPAIRRAVGSYDAQISRANPACLLFLIDQSGSMADPFIGAGGTSKAATVADAVNRLLQNVVLRSAKADGVRDYFRVGVIGYGTTVKAGLGGTTPFNVLVPVSRLGERPLRVDARVKKVLDAHGRVTEQKVKFPVWYDPVSGGQTAMCEALRVAGLAVKGFLDEFPNSYPPIVLNLTDGLPSDGNPQEAARAIRTISTADGNVLLFNLLISKVPVTPAYFPADEASFPETEAKLLFRMSSALPPKLWAAARNEGHAVKPGARGVVLNADPTAIVRFLDIGTRVSPGGNRPV
ncbi:VWA domain-containing protein [Gemmata sp. JC673]|uniref:VWA domain-containing protein n=1 Tax=Gemmata algarum TaxID=2975278 RepID=A0ABU5F6L4_9BACT|nr:hypothetical protein [Gemmata algarum]MDY3562367.1 VWA domain-containing protein [Gemmata algarum]